MLRYNEKGTAIVEFAIVLPLLLLLIFGMIEFSLLMYNKAMITNASREGARRGIVYRVDIGTSNYSPLTDGQIQAEVTNYLSNHLITFEDPPRPAETTIPPQVGNVPRTSGMLLSVIVSYDYQFLVFNVIAGLVGSGGTTIPGTITLTSATQMRME
jgi:Flp pilus assembly protein TadG